MTKRAVDIAADAVLASFPDLSKEQALEISIIVTKSLRNPTGLMVRNAAKIMTHEHRPSLDRYSHKEKHRLRYMAMIDGALGMDIMSVRGPKPDKRETDEK